MKKIFLSLNLIFLLSISGAQTQYTWLEQTSGTGNDLYELHFLNNFEGYAAGEYGVILKTLNAGADWTSISSPTIFSIVGMHFDDVNNGYILDTLSNVYKTTDGGISWTKIYGNILAPSHSMEKNGNRLFIGRVGDILYTDDSGTNWDSTTVPVTGNINNFSFESSTVGYLCGELGQIAKTLDGGLTWTFLSTGVTSYDINDLFVKTTGEVIAVGDFGIILVSTDGGINWTPITAPASGTLERIDFADNLNGLIVGHDNIVLETTNGGLLNWTLTPTSVATANFYDVHVGNDIIAFICGSDGKIFRSPGSTEDITPLFYTGPDTICLGQPFDFSFYFKNIGQGPSFNAEFQILANGNSLYGNLVTWLGTLNSGDSVDYIIPNTVLNTAGTVSITIFSTEPYFQGNNSLFFSIEVVAPKPYEVSQDQYFCSGDTLEIYASGGETYYWGTSFTNPTDSLQEVTPTTSTSYEVEIQQEFCHLYEIVMVFLDSTCIEDEEPIDTLVPITANFAFSPNSDGVNDILVLNFLGNESNVVSIFNRWGDKLVELENYNNVDVFWDGTYRGVPLPAGTYFIVVERENKEPIKNWVQLVK
ncbi:MAG: YCF48-related protein [Crocinitomicaceae bacterium]